MKKILLTAFALSLSMGAAHAADAKFDGFYGGLKAGYANGGIDIGADTTADVDGFGAGAFAGYGKTFGNWYVGGELSADYAKLRGSVLGSDVDAEKSRSFGAAVRAGYLVSPNVLGYGIVGVERGKFEVKVGDAEDSANLLGFRAGIGAETFMTKNVSLRTEVSYVNWGGKGDFDGADELRADVGVAYHF